MPQLISQMGGPPLFEKMEGEKSSVSILPSKFAPMSRRRKADLKKLYNLTEERYNSILESQGFGCKICGKPWTFEVLSVDHNHKTGEVRGLLCNNCNAMLGLSGENQTILLKAIQYLKGNL